MAVITENQVKSYRVADRGEWATIVLQPMERAGMHGGRLMIDSSYGCWSASWSNTGMPFDRFLAHVGADYLGTKLLGMHLNVFDWEASFERWATAVLAARRRRELTREQVVEALDGVFRESSGSADLMLYQIQMAKPYGFEHPLWEDPSEFISLKVNPRWLHFWRDLWEPFVKQALAEPSPTEQAA